MVFNITCISFRNVITKWLHFRVKYYNLQNFSLKFAKMLTTSEQICLFYVQFYFGLNKLVKCKNKVDHKFSFGLFNQNSELELKNKRNNSINSRVW